MRVTRTNKPPSWATKNSSHHNNKSKDSPFTTSEGKCKKNKHLNNDGKKHVKNANVSDSIITCTSSNGPHGTNTGDIIQGTHKKHIPLPSTKALGNPEFAERWFTTIKLLINFTLWQLHSIMNYTVVNTYKKLK